MNSSFYKIFSFDYILIRKFQQQTVPEPLVVSEIKYEQTKDEKDFELIKVCNKLD